MRIFILLLLISLCGVAHGDDRPTYDEGSRPKVLINWDSFEENGFPSEWKGPFTNVVINGYTRMNRLLGVDVRPQFFGYTTKTSSDPGEIVVMANEKHSNSNRLASAFGSFPDRLRIVFHRKRGSDDTVWNYTPYWNNPGEYSMYGVFMHELGHALGLDHSAPSKSIMSGGYHWTDHHGPWSGDVTDTRALYRLREDNRLRQFASYNGGGSWGTLSNDITNLAAPWARTTDRVAAAGNSSTHEYLVGWSTPDNRLTWIRGDGVKFDTDTWKFYSGHPRPRYGSDMVSNHDNYWMWAVVDGRDDNNRVRVLRSGNDGDSWAYTGFPEVQTSSTPGIAHTRIDGQSAWLVAWVNYDEDNRDQTGHIYGSVSFNNGGSWSEPHPIDDWYRAHDGVGIAADTNGAVYLSFVWAGESGALSYGQNKVRTIRADVSSDGIMTRSGLCVSPHHSRMAPDMIWHSGSDRFAQIVREQDFNTSLRTRTAATGNCPSGFSQLSGSTSHVAPGLARNPAWSVPGESNEIVLWYAR